MGVTMTKTNMKGKFAAIGNKGIQTKLNKKNE